MDNATPWEALWTAIFVVGLIFGAILLGHYISRLVRRYRLARNGGGRLLAWREVLLVGTLAVAAGLGGSLGLLAVISPQRPEQATGDVERWAMGVLAWYGAVGLTGIGVCVVAALAMLLLFEILISRYFRHHPVEAGDPGDIAARGMADESPFGPPPEPEEE